MQSVGMISAIGKMSAAVKKIGVMMKKSVEEMMRGAWQIRSASVSKSAEEPRSVIALMKIASVKLSESQRRRRVSAPLVRGSARKKSCEIEIGGLIVLKWFLVPHPTRCLPDLQM
jgi:ATP/maltotriose-dependent transcriptional regulator MalT